MDMLWVLLNVENLINMKVNYKENIKNQVAVIEASKGDPEEAHFHLDGLYVVTLKLIAKGVDNPEELAKEALKAEKIDFPRWCA